MASVFKRSSDRARRGARWQIKWLNHEAGHWRTQSGYTDKAASQ